MDHSMGMVWVESHQQLGNAEVDDDQRLKKLTNYFIKIAS